MQMQHTIMKSATVKGKGLFSGNECKLKFCPAPEDTGIVFLRVDLDPPVEIPADVQFVTKRDQRTTSLSRDGASVETTEHVLAAVWGMGIDNLRIELDNSEIPNIDGSSLPFVKALQRAGLEEQDLPRDVFVIDEPIVVSDGEATIAALPGPQDHLEIIYNLEYPCRAVGNQLIKFLLFQDDFAEVLSPARTFCLEEEARQFQAMGLAPHLTAKDVLVINDAGPVDNKFRFDNEPVRHKVLDLVGDVALLGRRFYGRLLATRSGHDLNQQLVDKLVEAIAASEHADALSEPVMDIRKIMKLLPHRYPFLMIDRIVRIEGDSLAVGVKNVTFNEPFFQGHYPDLPIMPGVLIIEAMAQLSGILMSRRLEHAGKTAVLLSLDRVKLRRPVRPGDQLFIEAEALSARSRTGHCRCKATVNDELAAEAEIKFMLVDAEPY
ncbi:MAG: UDP-3-O-[3-hydroxymyristoyl] N-acetylglucosamine deacetylase [Phycisphaerales bacterium]|jgi:UDP-3-O-[3-hydroxymyristoyl] N-acetylglucosamine deacetylase / 3-hydroxyacyl-[acyl-carrier-protein] dehydratase|nr:UDP-3-O-[3-hydroxymyristoyl] N-acetylglucosamine deacetylase [Phycisphaerales bacterium]MBT7171173.1 UDP-3-O-[3-hydroxymyristoyl] N-acetylglucosamine deacetylase [Phycisphaerales bacterium]